MRLATVAGQTRVPARPGQRAICPTCGCEVLAKCGRIVAWHWAHASSRECDEWAEPDSVWHRGWQDLFPVEMREIIRGPHRADIVTPAGLVIELQHSSISTDDIRARERHYDNMIWVFDVQGAVSSERLDIRRRAGDTSPYRTFRWKHPRKSIIACRRPVFLDLGGEQLLELGRLYPKAPCGGWGYLRNKLAFVSRHTTISRTLESA